MKLEGPANLFVICPVSVFVKKAKGAPITEFRSLPCRSLAISVSASLLRVMMRSRAVETHLKSMRLQRHVREVRLL